MVDGLAQTPTKEVASCHKPGVAACRFWTQDLRITDC